MPALVVLALPTTLAVVEVLLSNEPRGHFWTWALSCLLAAGATLLCTRAAHRTPPTLAPSWWALAVGAGTMALALLARRPTGLEVEPAEATLADHLMLLPVGPFLLASLLRLGGEPIRVRRLKLLLDVLILGLSPALAALLLAELTTREPWVQPETQLLASAYAVSYTALAFAVLVSVRGTALPRGDSPAWLLLIGAGLLALAALLTSARLLGLAPYATGIGQSFWGVGIGLLGVAGLRAASGSGTGSPDRPQSVVQDESRLRLVPSGLAGLVVLAIAIVEMTRGGAPMHGIFLGSLTLLSLLVGRQMVTLVDNRRLLGRVLAAGEGDERLRDFGLALHKSLDLSEVLRKLCEVGRDVVRADVVFLWTPDPSGEALETVQVVGASASEFLGRRVSVSDRGSVVARVYRTCQPEIVQSSRLSRMVDQRITTMLGAQSLLAMPVGTRHEGDVVRAAGVLLFVRRHADMPFDDGELAKAQVLVSQAVFAIMNAQLYTQQRHRLDEMAALYEFTNGVSSALSATTIAEHLLDTIKRRPGYERGRVLLRERDTGVFRAVVIDGAPRSGWIDSSGPSALARRALAEGAPVREEADGPQRSARLAVPLVLQDRVLGVVELEAAPGGSYSSSEEALVRSLANQAALAIDNLHLMEDARHLEALREMNQLKSDLLSTVSHELRTPLGSIKGYVSTLLNYESKLRREERNEFLRIIDEESDRLTELIENLLDMSRLEAGVLKVERRPVDLEPVARRVVERAAGLTSKHTLRVEWHLRAEVVADPRRISQVLSNLVENAIKYSPDGGVITVRAARSGREAVISVSDQGVGIPGWQLERVFERFHRVEGEVTRRVGGTGLGLAICRGLVEAHHGRIWAESEPGRGSTFHFTLPLHTCNGAEEE